MLELKIELLKVPQNKLSVEMFDTFWSIQYWVYVGKTTSENLSSFPNLEKLKWMIIESEQNARQVFIYLSSFPVQLPAKKCH